MKNKINCISKWATFIVVVIFIVFILTLFGDLLFTGGLEDGELRVWQEYAIIYIFATLNLIGLVALVNNYKYIWATIYDDLLKCD
tara:strand:+ start:15540 stop:15794 length:255 start_codon:yes stop_codon:yes gene_type:complete